jgi:hypothetical protein
MAEEGDTYCQSGTVDYVAVYPCGSEAKDNAAYHHGGTAKDDAAYSCGSAATKIPNICVILKKISQTQTCDIVVFCQ